MGKNTWLSLVLIVVLSACSGISTAGADTKGHKLFVFLSGFTSALSAEDVAGNGGYGSSTDFFSSGRIQPFLQEKFPGSYFLTYSYKGFTPDGKPLPYTCPLSVDNYIADLAVGLRNQISQFLRSHSETPKIDIYVIGHSLGGVIAFSFLAQMVEGKNILLDSFPNEGRLRAVFTLDSPIGGVTDHSLYMFVSALKTLNSCRGASFIRQPVVRDLNTLFNSAPSSDFQGSDAIIPQMNPHPNQKVALDAMEHGVTISTFGNTNDVLWQPSLCTSRLLADFLSTQWLREVTSGVNSQGGAIYARSFTSGKIDCNALSDPSDPANHFAILSRSDVHTAIWQVILGVRLDALAALSPTPPPDFTRFVGSWGAHARTLEINSNGHALYTGRVFVACGPGVQQPCDDFQHLGEALHSEITLTRVNGNTAYGTITGGTGDRDDNSDQRPVIPVGSPILFTLKPDNVGNYTLLQGSDGFLLCNARVSTTDPYYAVGCQSGA